MAGPSLTRLSIPRLKRTRMQGFEGLYRTLAPRLTHANAAVCGGRRIHPDAPQVAACERTRSEVWPEKGSLKRWLRVPEFIAEYRQARWEVVEQAYARAQQNTSAATTVLLMLMADSKTPHSSRIRAALGVFDIAREGLDLDIETRVAALERAAEASKESR